MHKFVALISLLCPVTAVTCWVGCMTRDPLQNVSGYCGNFVPTTSKRFWLLCCDNRTVPSNINRGGATGCLANVESRDYPVPCQLFFLLQHVCDRLGSEEGESWKWASRGPHTSRTHQVQYVNRHKRFRTRTLTDCADGGLLLYIACSNESMRQYLHLPCYIPTLYVNSRTPWHTDRGCICTQETG